MESCPPDADPVVGAKGVSIHSALGRSTGGILGRRLASMTTLPRTALGFGVTREASMWGCSSQGKVE